MLFFLGGGLDVCRVSDGGAVWSLHQATQVVKIIMHKMVGNNSEALMHMQRLYMTEQTVANDTCR